MDLRCLRGRFRFFEFVLAGVPAGDVEDSVGLEPEIPWAGVSGNLSKTRARIARRSFSRRSSLAT